MKELTKDYRMSNADLAMYASNLVGFMNRDSTEFAARGVDAAAITAFEALGNAFEVFPPDEYYRADISGEVELKETARDNATDMIQTISGYFEQEWGLDNFRYKRLRIKGYQTMSDNNFLYTCRNVVAVATEYLADLTPIGLTQAMIDDLEAEAQTFEDKLNSISQKKAERDSKTQERTEKGNELYLYIKKYTTIGKLIWENIDEAKYNDYIIYHRPPGVPGKVQNLAFDIPTTTASWDAETLATNYELEIKENSPTGVYAAVYSGANTSTVYDPGSGAWIFRCRATNDEGSGEWSDELDVIIPV